MLCRIHNFKNELLHIVPEELPSDLAIFTEPLAAALEILDQVHIKPSTKKLVSLEMDDWPT